MPVDVVVDSEPVLRALRDLATIHAPRAVAEALNKTAFDVIDAEKAHVLDIFQFAGPSTSRFIGGSFRFNRATQSKHSVEIFPLRASEEILRDHTRGERYTADDVSKLEQDRELAIPVAVRRTRSGRVGKKLTPQAITGVGGRGFVSKGAILQRVGKQRYPLRVAYVLSRAARNKPVFRFYEVARTTVAKVFAEKARRAIEKELLARAGVAIRRAL